MTRTSRFRARPQWWIERIGRVGLITQGVLYAVVGLLALQVASGRNDQADQRGAIEAVSDQPFGRALLAVLTVGLALHALWRFVLAARGQAGEEEAKSVAKRVGELGRGLLYAGFTVAAASVVVGARQRGQRQPGDEQRKAVATVLDVPGGALLVTVAGVAVIGTGLWHVSKVVTRTFLDDLDLGGRSRRVRQAVTVLGSVGYAARGIVFVMVGWFLIESALDDDPNHTGGFDQALKRVAASDHGPLLLRLLAAGLFLFGVYRVIDGWLRDRSAVTRP